MISPRAADSQVLINAGPLGTVVEFVVTGWGHFENKVWAALVRPVDPNFKVYSGELHITPLLRLYLTHSKYWIAIAR